jgi:hypothetical protein
LYVILSVLALISVVPMYFYSEHVEAINRERLITNERLLQNTVTRSLADDISQHQESLRMMLANLSSALQVASGGDITAEHVEAPELRALLEHFVSSSADLAYATLVNSESKGISAGASLPTRFCNATWYAPMTPPVKAAPTAARHWSWVVESRPAP